MAAITLVKFRRPWTWTVVLGVSTAYAALCLYVYVVA